jgi:hypothetical protein
MEGAMKKLFLVFLLLSTQIFGTNGELFFLIQGYTYEWQLHFDKIPGEIYYDQNINVANPPDYEFEYSNNFQIIQADAVHGDNNNGTIDKNGNEFLVYFGKFKITFECNGLSRTFYMDYSDCDYLTANHYFDGDLYFLMVKDEDKFILTNPSYNSNYGDFTDQTFNIWEHIKDLGYQYQNTDCFYLNVTARNIVNNQNYGFITINGEPVYPSTPVSLLKGTEPLFSTYSNIIEGNQLFRNWSSSSFNNPENIEINNSTSIIEARFYPTQPLTVTNYLEGGTSNDNFEITWQDVKPPEQFNFGNQYNAFQYSTTGDRYTIKAKPIQHFNTTWSFLNWNTGSTYDTIRDIRVNVPITYTANYKGNLASNQTDGFSSNGQRKIVRDNSGYYHCVYSSLGKVWYTKSTSTNFAGNWTQDVDVFGGYNARNPSIDVDANNNIAIVAESGDETGTAIVLYRSDGSPFEYVDDSIDPSYYGSSYPVISRTNNEIFILYKTSNSSLLKYKSNSIIDPVLWQNVAAADITCSTSNSKNPTIVKAGTNNILHIAWQEGTSEIKYVYSTKPNTTRYFDPLQSVSGNCGYTYNTYPSISLSNTGVVVSWSGSRKENVQEKSLGKENSQMTYVHRALIRVKAGSWGNATVLGSDVNFTNNNSSTSGSGETVIAFSQNNGQTSKWIKRVGAYYSEVSSLSHNGLQVNVSNGSSLANQKAMVFNTTALPYPINRSTTSFSSLEKITSDTSVTYGRTGIVGKQGMEFLFCVEDILLDDENIKFTERVDTLPVLNLNELNSIAKTNTFNLNGNSDLYFSLYYLVINPELAASVLTNEDYVNFKLELVNADNNSVAGTFDDITYTKENVNDYENLNYKVDCEGIAAGNYYLRIAADANSSTGLSITNNQNDAGLLGKKSYTEIFYTGNTTPIEYSLAQNFPNPFNPSTTIRYQLPKDGMVTLKIYNILGSEVTTLINEEKVAGKYQVNFNASSLASGVYIYRISSGSFTASKKLMLLK